MNLGYKVFNFDHNKARIAREASAITISMTHRCMKIETRQKLGGTEMPNFDLSKNQLRMNKFAIGLTEHLITLNISIFRSFR